MSVQFGRWNFEGSQPAQDYIKKVCAILAQYGPDSDESYSNGGITILYRAFHTTKESRRETQPHISRSGVVITWDGRLDNRAELISELRTSLGINSPDVEIVSAAYDNWGPKCFGKLVGDWALSVWNPLDRSLILAKDPIGPRHLFYSFDNKQASWSTILEPLVQFAGKTFEISEEYIAGSFAHLSATHLTPYVGIHAVPPSSSVLIRPRQHKVEKYWDFDPGKSIRYRTDAEYEEHFRTVFATAVRRRLRSDRPVLAELSGGMDSSSIVCMADIVIARGEAETPRLDTISYYDDSNAVLDERPYFTMVELKRGRVGYHIDLGARRQIKKDEAHSKERFWLHFESDQLAATPDSNRTLWPELFERYAPYMRTEGYRVTLSGIAGEAATGGFVPAPTLELQNLLVRARLFRLAHQLRAWARKMGKPALPLLWEALRGFSRYSATYPWAPDALCPPPWFQPGFVERNKAALLWYPSRLALFGGLPSFQNQIQLLNHTRKFLAYRNLWAELLREIRYPYLDRDLLEFACAIPREQMVGVGRRRFLMKRALAGIVPDELLNRKRREVTPKPEEDISWPSVTELGSHIISDSLGIIQSGLFLEAVQKARGKGDIALDSLKRSIVLEYWLRHLASEGVLRTGLIPAHGADCSSLDAERKVHIRFGRQSSGAES